MKTFARVAELKSFSAAAASMQITPVKTSRHVADLEAHLGIRLLNRSTRRVELSEAGERYYPECVALLESLEGLDQRVSGLGEVPSGTLRVSAPTDFAQLHLREAIREFLSQCPELKIEMHLDDRQVNLLDQHLDVAIRIAELPESSLIARKLGEACIACYASPDYLAMHGEPAMPHDLEQHQVIEYALSPNPGRWTFEIDGQVQFINVPWRLSVNNGSMIADAASRGLGIVRLPEFIVRNQVADGTLLEILKPYRTQPRNISAVYQERKFNPAKIRVFVSFLLEYFERHRDCFSANLDRPKHLNHP